METARLAEPQPQPQQRASLTQACARLADATPFNLAIFAVIVANAVVLGLETYDGVVREDGGLLSALNDLFLAIFVAELLIRIAAFGSRPQRFFRDGWNVFDFVVIAAAFLPGLRENATLLRLARLARILRVVRLLPDLRVLTVAVARSLPGVASLTVLAVLLVYVYGMLGWVIFAEHDPEHYGTIGDAMLTQFVLLSLEGLPEAIDRGLELSGWTVLYFVSYTLIAAFLLLNLLIGVVIDSLDEAHKMEAERALAERRAAAAATEDPEDDRRLAIEDRIRELRATLDALEQELRAGPPKAA